MCKAMEDMRNETATATKLEDVKNIMETMKLSIELLFTTLNDAPFFTLNGGVFA